MTECCIPKGTNCFANFRVNLADPSQCLSGVEVLCSFSLSLSNENSKGTAVRHGAVLLRYTLLTESDWNVYSVLLSQNLLYQLGKENNYKPCLTAFWKGKLLRHLFLSLKVTKDLVDFYPRASLASRFVENLIFVIYVWGNDIFFHTFFRYLKKKKPPQSVLLCLSLFDVPLNEKRLPGCVAWTWHEEMLYRGGAMKEP